MTSPDDPPTQRLCPWCGRAQPVTHAFCSSCGTSLQLRPHAGSGTYHLYAEGMRACRTRLESLLALDAQGEGLVRACNDMLTVFLHWQTHPPAESTREAALRQALDVQRDVDAYVERVTSFRSSSPPG